MRALLFSAVAIACAIPAFGQTATPRHARPDHAGPAATTENRSAAHVRDLCQPVGVVPAVPVVIIPSGVPGSGLGASQGSGIGAIERSGVGSIERSGVGHIERSGVGSIGASGIGALPALPSPTVAVPSAPVQTARPSWMPPAQIAQPVPFGWYPSAAPCR